MTVHEITVSDTGISPSYTYNVQKGDTIRFRKQGGSVLGVEVAIRYTSSTQPLYDGLETIFGVRVILFPSTGSTVDMEVLVAVTQPTAYEMEPLFASQPAKGRGGPRPTEKGGVVVVGGTGPFPIPDKPKRIPLKPTPRPGEQRP